MEGSILWGAPAWIYPAAGLGAAALVVLMVSYWFAAANLPVRAAAMLLKIVGVAALAVCLVEPLFSGTRPRPGANLFIVLADNSQSMQIQDRAARASRGERVKTELAEKSSWLTRLEQDFDVRRYTFDDRLRAVDDFESLDFQGGSSSLQSSLQTVSSRFRGRATAGVLLLSDGNIATTADDFDAAGLPPIYPVLVGGETPADDIAIDRVSVSQTNFEETPVTIRAEITTAGYSGKTIVAQLLDEAGEVAQTQSLDNADDERTIACRFQFRPPHAGISFYRLRVFAEGAGSQFEDDAKSAEATLANNERFVAVDRGGGPYRILYMCGRPNWEFKFMRRALDADDEVGLVGLIRIAKREPKFSFRDNRGDKNPLFKGFEKESDEEAEEYDQPVLMRINTLDESELRDGFPKAADDLYKYHAVVIDDLEAEFFTQDQMSLLASFVSHRGGGLLMLGGLESFRNGQYSRTPIGELLPVYLDRDIPGDVGEGYHLSLTREGWLQPWVRVRSTEEEERGRLAAMPPFKTLSRVDSIKPGATILANVSDNRGDEFPALVAQRFGNGRTAALTIGDLWRWSLRREEGEQRDMEKAWRQLARWLVAEAPGRVATRIQRTSKDGAAGIEVRVQVKTAEYEPLDNATVSVAVTAPDGKIAKLTAAGGDNPGEYTAMYYPRQSGPYRASVIATGPDSEEIGRKQDGWTSNPAADEFQNLTPNRALLEELAAQTEGDLVELSDLGTFASSLPNRKIPVTEHWVYPLWHTPAVFLLAVFCLCAEWGLRRWNGLA